MTQTWLKTMSSVALAIMLALTLSMVPVAGQGAREHQPQDAEKIRSQESSERSAGARRLEGTWLVQVTPRDCQTGAQLGTFPSLLSYARGGVMVETTSSIRPALRYPGQGVWRHVGGQRYAATFMFFRFNPDGSFAGTQQIKQDIQLSKDGEELNITATFEIIHANGAPPTLGCVTTVGRRFGFE